MIYGIGYIDPSKRYQAIPGWYKKCVLFHSKKYHKLLETTVVPADTICIDAETGVTETHKKIIANYFKGSRLFVNIGAAGVLDWGQEDKGLKIGDVIEPTAILHDAGLSKFFTDDWVSVNEDHYTVGQPVTVQCVPTLYYDKGFLEEDVHCVEQESEAVAVTCRWLNHNYGEKYGLCKYANIFYISDTVHRDGRPWQDTLKMYEHTRDEYRRKVLNIALAL